MVIVHAYTTQLCVCAYVHVYLRVWVCMWVYACVYVYTCATCVSVWTYVFRYAVELQLCAVGGQCHQMHLVGHKGDTHRVLVVDVNAVRSLNQKKQCENTDAQRNSK